MRETWRLIDTGGNNGIYNMAVDEAISIACREGKAPPTLRFYTWEPSCISIGYFQRIDRVLKRERSYEKDTKVVRRITGGRAVVHGNDLSYSIVCNRANSLFPDNIKGTYYAIAGAFIKGLIYLGITPDPPDTLNPESYAPGPAQYHHSTFCFDTMLGHEICVGGRKLIGSAQRRWSDTFLQHGSILITGSQQENGSTSISLNELLGGNPDLKVIKAAFSEGLQETLKTNLIGGELTVYEIEIAERLTKEKYLKVSWNIRYPY